MRERRTAQERMEEIVMASMHILANDGLGKLTTANIARQVGISEGAIFRHFSSKDDILLQTLARIEGILETPEPEPDGCPLEELKKFFLRRLELLRSQPDLVRILFSMQLEQALGPENHARISRLKQNSIRLFRILLTRGQETKVIRTDLRVDLMQILLMGMLQSLVFHANFAPRENPDPTWTPNDIWKTAEAFLRG